MPKRIVIDDFRGGRNTLDAPYTIKPNQHITGSQNVWAEQKYLTKRRGFTRTTSPAINADAAIGTTAQFRPRQLLATQLAASSTGRMVLVGTYDSTNFDIVGLAYTDNGTSFQPLGYTDGTITTPGSSTTVNGSGGQTWNTGGLVAVGDWLAYQTGADHSFANIRLARITAINSDTQLVIANAINLSSATAYTIIQALDSARPIAMSLFDVSSAQNVIISDGARTPVRYTGVSIAVISAMPQAEKILVHKGYVFILGQDTTDIEWSALRDVTTWPAANAQAVTNIGNPTRGFTVYGDHIVIFCRSKMFRLLGDTFDPANPTYVLEEITVPADFLFTYPRTAVMHKGVLKFLAQDGWYGYDGGNAIYKISQQIQDDVDGFRRPGVTAEGFADSCVAFVWKDRMWVSVVDNDEATQDELNSVYVQDENGGWWKWQGSDFGYICDYAAIRFGTTGSTNLYGVNNTGATGPGFGTSVTGLMTLDTALSDFSAAAAYTGTWISKDFAFVEDVEIIQIIVMSEKLAAGGLRIGASVDQGTYSEGSYGTSTGGIGTLVENRFAVGKVGKAIRVRLREGLDGVGGNFLVYSVIIEYEPGESWRI